MKHLAHSTAILVLASLALPSPAVANNNLNSSRSNIYRLASSTTLINSKQATAILEALDKTPGMDEAAIKQALPQLLKKNGVDPAKVKDTVVRRDKGGKSFSIILTDKPEDLRAAIAMTDAPPSKTQPKNEKQ